MDGLLQHLVDQPIANMIVFVGFALLFVGAVGKITERAFIWSLRSVPICYTFPPRRRVVLVTVAWKTASS